MQRSMLDTMSRASLADAVALVRGDRYLTYDCTPFNLTAWGFTEGSRNTQNFAWGGILGRVINRALPLHFPATSVFIAFPLVTPSGQPHSMDMVLRKLGQFRGLHVRCAGGGEAYACGG